MAHHIALSIVGVDRVGCWGYYAGKLAQEKLVLAGPVPATVLRATQFHEFTGQVLAGTRGSLAVVPRMRVQPVAAREVGQVLAELAVTEPAVAWRIWPARPSTSWSTWPGGRQSFEEWLAAGPDDSIGVGEPAGRR